LIDRETHDAIETYRGKNKRDDAEDGEERGADAIHSEDFIM